MIKRLMVALLGLCALVYVPVIIAKGIQPYVPGLVDNSNDFMFWGAGILYLLIVSTVVFLLAFILGSLYFWVIKGGVEKSPKYNLGDVPSEPRRVADPYLNASLNHLHNLTEQLKKINRQRNDGVLPIESVSSGDAFLISGKVIKTYTLPYAYGRALVDENLSVIHFGSVKETLDYLNEHNAVRLPKGRKAK